MSARACANGDGARQRRSPTGGCANRMPRYAELFAYARPRSVAPEGSVADDIALGFADVSRVSSPSCCKSNRHSLIRSVGLDICAIMAPAPATDTALPPVEDTSAASTKTATPIDPELERCAVATIVNGDALELFAVGDDAELYHRTERRSSSSAWASLGRPAALRGGPTAIRTVLGGLLLAACADDGQFHVRLRRSSNKWDAWQAVAAPEGGCAWQPTLLLGADGGIHAFATTPGSGRLWEASWGRDGPPTTPTWGFLSGEASAVPSAELDADGLAHLFVRGPAGALFERAQTRGGGWASGSRSAAARRRQRGRRRSRARST